MDLVTRPYTLGLENNKKATRTTPAAAASLVEAAVQVYGDQLDRDGEDLYLKLSYDGHPTIGGWKVVEL